MHDARIDVIRDSVAERRFFVAEFRILDCGHDAELGLIGLRLGVGNGDPIARQKPVAQIAMAGAFVDLIFDDAENAPG
jgi:hypothetical protein